MAGPRSRNSKRSMDDDGDISDTPRPVVKRTRASRACDQCRASREKCEGRPPVCQTCANQDRECSYNELPKKRGIPPNYIRTLEILCAWFIESCPDQARHLSQRLGQPETREAQILSHRDPSAAETLHSVWRNALLSRQIEQSLSGSCVSLPSPTSVTGSREDSSTAATISITEKEPVPPSPTAMPPQDRLRLPKDALKMLEYYFAFTQCWIPLTNKPAMLKLLYQYPADGCSIEVLGEQHCELVAILALVSLQRSQALRTGAEEAHRLRDIVWRHVAMKYKDADGLDYIRPLLLIALSHIVEEAFTPAWLALGLAVRMLLLCKESAGSAWQPIALTAYVLEGALASQLQAPHHLTAHLLQLDQLPEDDLDEWTPWSDPFDDTHCSAKAPSRASTNFKQLLSLASETEQSKTSSSQMMYFVSTLARNGAEMKDRMHPHTLLNTMMGHDGPSAPALQPIEDIQRETNIMTYLRVPTNLSPDFSTPVIDQTGKSESQVSSRSVPEQLFSATTHDSIFEELAMMEQPDTSQQQPAFMQNLGFGPDFDLAEFFGADYQPSDPFLTYMQPLRANSFADPQLGASSTDPG